MNSKLALQKAEQKQAKELKKSKVAKKKSRPQLRIEAHEVNTEASMHQKENRVAGTKKSI